MSLLVLNHLNVLPSLVTAISLRKYVFIIVQFSILSLVQFKRIVLFDTLLELEERKKLKSEEEEKEEDSKEVHLKYFISCWLFFFSDHLFKRAPLSLKR